MSETWSEGGRVLLRKISGNTEFDEDNNGGDGHGDGTKDNIVNSELFPEFDVTVKTYSHAYSTRTPANPSEIEDQAFHAVL